jgi:stage V sporulation protein S
MDVIRVSATSRTAAVAGAIAGVVRDHHRVDVQAIGAGAINQTVKALVMATGYLKKDGIYIKFVPTFSEVTIHDQVITAVKFVVEPTAESTFPIESSIPRRRLETRDAGSRLGITGAS